MVEKKKLIEKINAAKQEILDAQNELDRLLREMKVAPRSDKVVISEVVENAFARVKTATTLLVELENLVGTKED